MTTVRYPSKVLATVLLFFFLSVVTASAQCAVEAYFSPYDDAESIVLKRLSEAKETVHCSLYGITNPKITATLKTLISQGVDVKLCLDKMQSAGKSSTHGQLRGAGADVVIKKTGVLEHNKFCVIDGARVIMGSWNYSGNAQRQDNSLVDISGCDPIIRQFQDAFQRIYERDK
jgi:mitochondrial cardiolipin hydrolase